ncbi:MAG TPA: hypothetical protein VJI33_00925 [Candidatus Paceibacterota bacterium]
MWLLTVTPISRGIGKDELYYFSSERVEEGDLIEVPLRSRQIVAKVESVRAVMDAKSELKNLPFVIRKVATFKLPKFFSSAFMDAAADASMYFASTLGSTLYALLPPKRLLSVMEGFIEDKEAIKEKPEARATFVIQAPDDERVALYRRLIREEFAKKKSVYLVAPTIAEAARIYKEINKGIEDYTFLLHQRLAKPKIGEVWKKASALSHPILLVCTALFLGLPRKDIGSVVIERESSKIYKKESRPFVDYRVFVHQLAKHHGAQVIHGDSVIRSETYERLDANRWYEYGKTSFRSLSEAKTELVFWNGEKMRQSKVSLAPEIFAQILKNREQSGHLLILSPRRGLSPRTICRNCGKSVSCPSCGGALVLHGEHRQNAEEKSKYLCHRCGTEVNSMIRCERCNSWDLVPLGVGSERIEEEIKKFYPDQKIFRADRDTVKRDIDADKIVEKFFSSAGSVLVGTELILSRLDRKVETSVVLYPELLTTVPEYSSDEEAMRLITRLRSLTNQKFMIQTADPESPLLKWSENANMLEFYRQELDIRQKLNYPPFSIIIMISWKPDEEIKKQLETMLTEYKPVFFESYMTGSKKENRVMIRLNPKDWPNKELREKLLSLPLSCAVEVAPDRIFS